MRQQAYASFKARIDPIFWVEGRSAHCAADKCTVPTCERTAKMFAIFSASKELQDAVNLFVVQTTFTHKKRIELKTVVSVRVLKATILTRAHHRARSWH